MKAFTSSTICLMLALCLALPPSPAAAADEAGTASAHRRAAATDPRPTRSLSSRTLRAVIEQLQAEDKRKSAIIENLLNRVEQLETGQHQSVQKLEVQEKKESALQAAVATQVKQQVQEQLSGNGFSGFMDSYLGQNRFVLTGYAAGTFEYDRNTNTNTFAAGFNPIILYRLSDRIAFESELEVELPSDAETVVNLEYAQSDVFLNDHLQLVIGKTLLPFGDFIEDIHPAWINRLASFPLPYREGEGLIPFTTTGVQARGGVQAGSEGQGFDYSLIVSNTPKFEEPDLVGSSFTPNNIKTNTHGVAYGGRLRVYPLPLAAHLGRLEVGASTFDGKWRDGLWFTSWGVDTAYHAGPLEVFAEYLETHRQMPAPMTADNRQGWYVQLGYQLSDLHISPAVDNYLNRVELVSRYSGRNQRAIIMDPSVPAAPGNGMSVSRQLMVPHAREVALGLDYWITPSIVWKLEYDIELPLGGGVFLTPDGDAMPAFNLPTDRAVVTQFAVGF